MAILDEIEEGVTSHPVLWIGGVLALLVVIYLASSGGSKQATSNFTYSVGPTDAQIAAGTAQQNQIQADQTAVSLANINATSNQTVAGDYFNYLTTNSANNLSATNAQTAASLSLGTLNSNNSLALGTLQSNNALTGLENTNSTNYNTTISNNSTAQEINSNNNSTYLQAGNYAGQIATLQAQSAANAASAASLQSQLTTANSNLASANAATANETNMFTNLANAVKNLLAPHSGMSAAQSISNYAPAVIQAGG